MPNMKTLYDEAVLNRLKKRKTILLTVTVVILAVTVGVCIYLAATATTATMDRHEFITMAVFVLGGWTCMTLYYWGIGELKKESAHMEHMLEKTPEVLIGDVELTRQWVRIPNSITIREVKFDDGEHVKNLHLNRRFVKEFPAKDKKIRMKLNVASGYIIGYEEAAS